MTTDHPLPFPNPTRYDFIAHRSLWRASRDGATGIGLTRTEALMDLELRLSRHLPADGETP